MTVIFYEFRVLLCIGLISYFCIILTERKCFRGRLNKRERLCGQIRWQLLFQKLWPCRAATINYQRDTQASRRLYVCVFKCSEICVFRFMYMQFYINICFTYENGNTMGFYRHVHTCITRVLFKMPFMTL